MTDDLVRYEMRCKCWPLVFVVTIRRGTTHRKRCPKCGSNQVEYRLQAERERPAASKREGPQ